MPHQKRNFIEGEYYHVIFKKAGGEKMFIDENDFFRMVFSLYEFNDNALVSIPHSRRSKYQKSVGGSPPYTFSSRDVGDVKNGGESGGESDDVRERDKLVDIPAFCLMPNHVHLLLTPVKEGGITQFMSKVMPGYASYYKNRYEIKERGHFYQDRFHAVHIENESQLKVVFVYIHTNPVSLIYPKWKEGAKIEANEAFQSCLDYKWSSLMDYLNIKNFPSVTHRDFINSFIGGPKGCEKNIKDWLKHKEEMIEKYGHLLIE